MKTTILFLCSLLVLATNLKAAVGVSITNKPVATMADSDVLFGTRVVNGTNQTVNTVISNMFTGRVLQWGSTGGRFRIRTNTTDNPWLQVEYIDGGGVVVTNQLFKTNGVPDFPNGASATLLSVGLQTVNELVMTAFSNGVVILNPTGKVVVVTGTAGTPLVATTTTPLFSNGMAVANLYGTGTGTGISSPTNWYLKNLYVTNTVESLASANRVQIDWSSQLAFYKHFTNAVGMVTNVILQLTNLLDNQKMTIRIPGALGSTIASNYSVTVSPPSGYKVDWDVATNGVNDFLVTSNQVAYVELTKLAGTNAVRATKTITQR